MLTVLGTVFILFACVAFVMNKISQQRRQIEAARSFRQAFSYLAERMDFTLEPLPTLLRQAAQEDFGEAGEFIGELARQLTDGQNRTLSEIWHETLHTYAQRLSLTPATIRILKNVGSKMGQLAGMAEIENLNRADVELSEEIRRCEEDFSKNAKLLKSSGVLVGILIVILFL